MRLFMSSEFLPRLTIHRGYGGSPLRHSGQAKREPESSSPWQLLATPVSPKAAEDEHDDECDLEAANFRSP